MQRIGFASGRYEGVRVEEEERKRLGLKCETLPIHNVFLPKITPILKTFACKNVC